MVNNVASGDPAGLFEVTPDRFAELMAVNLTSAWQVTRHAVPVLPRGGAIVNISSVTVRARGPGMVYSLTGPGGSPGTSSTSTAGRPAGRRRSRPRTAATATDDVVQVPQMTHDLRRRAKYGPYNSANRRHPTPL